MHVFINVLAKELIGTDFVNTTRGPIYNVTEENNRIIFRLGNSFCNVPMNEEICLIMEVNGKQPRKRTPFLEGSHSHIKNRVLCKNPECDLLKDNDYV